MTDFDQYRKGIRDRVEEDEHGVLHITEGPDHHYASLLQCGHYRETKASWNVVIETGRPSHPIESWCPHCQTFETIVKFARVDE